MVGYNLIIVGLCFDRNIPEFWMSILPIPLSSHCTCDQQNGFYDPYMIVLWQINTLFSEIPTP